MTAKERLRKIARAIFLTLMIVSAVHTSSGLFWAYNNSHSVNDILLPLLKECFDSVQRERKGEPVPAETKLQLSVTLHQGLILLKDIPDCKYDCRQAGRGFGIFLVSLLALKLIKPKGSNLSR